MSERLKLLMFVTFNNTIRVLEFLALAMFFHMWWISLFSILFLDNVKNKEE